MPGITRHVINGVETTTATSPTASTSASSSVEQDIEAMDETVPLVSSKKRGSASSNVKQPSPPRTDMSKDPTGVGLWLQGLSDAFGPKLLIMLFVSQHLMKGFVNALIGPASQFMYASYNVRGPRMQVFGSVASLPWAMKPIIGLMSDCFPIGGVNKAPYIMMASVFGAASMGALGLLPQTHLSIENVVCCLFLIQLMLSTTDLLCEAKYAEKMQSNAQRGPELMTFVWFGMQVGGLLATICVGPLMHHVSQKAPYTVALVPCLMIFFPLARNYLEERPQTPEEVQESRDAFRQQKEACMLCVLMFAGTLLLTALGILFESVYVNAFAAIGVAIVMLVAFSLVLRPMIAKVNAFFLIQTSLGFSIGGAAFYFYTDDETKYPDGPHFSMEFFTSVLGVLGSVCSLIGIFLYQRYMKDWTYRRMLLMTNLVLSFLSIADLLMFTRTNKRLGIPDHAFVMGASVLQTVVGQWMWMPGVVILSQLCPKGMEATMYALLAGCHNLGNTIASNCGALVLELLNCTPSGAPDEGAAFQHLWVGSALSTVLPMFTLLLLPWLIPDAKQTDKLIEDGDRDATAGSLWKRLTGQLEPASHGL